MSTAAAAQAPPIAPIAHVPPSGSITRARKRELKYIMRLKNEGPEA
jgi:hypothetical protein